MRLYKSKTPKITLRCEDNSLSTTFTTFKKIILSKFGQDAMSEAHFTN